MVRDAGRGVEMMQRSMARDGALRQALAALHAGRFAEARDLAAGWRVDPAGGALHALGLAGAGDVAGGGAALDAAARANPAARHPVFDLVELLRAQRREGEAPAHVAAALAHQPGRAALLGLLGATLAETGPTGAAIGAFAEAARVAPGGAAAWSNLGKALAAAGRFDEAEGAFGRAALLAPGEAQVRLNHGVARLKAGRWAEGWPLFRARHDLPGHAGGLAGAELRDLRGVAGKTVLLVHDEGFGDTLQFIRYAPLLAGLGARVVVWAPPPLVRLLRGMEGIAEVAECGGHRTPRGGGVAYDAWCRVADLPGVFGTTVETIPGALPYLAADPGLVAAWSGRLPSGCRVGLVWAGAGRPHDPGAAATDRQRSLRADMLGPLLGIAGIDWVSLQQGLAPPGGVFDPMPGVADFADTAAIIEGLELVVSVDTAVAHLVAAMGRRVILLDRYDSCWRWLHGRADSPWYPGRVSILRQQAPGDWGGVLRRVAGHPWVAALAGGSGLARP